MSASPRSPASIILLSWLIIAFLGIGPLKTCIYKNEKLVFRHRNPPEHNVKNATKAVSAGGQAVTAANQAVEKGGGTKPMTEAASAGETAARGVVVSGTVTSVPESGPRMCLITMVKDEHDKFASWVPYYLGEGADFIYVIDDRSDPPLEYDHPNVRIDHIDGKHVTTPNVSRELSKRADKQTILIEAGIEKVIFNRNCTWTISVDIDEFVTTYHNENRTVKEELLQSFRKHNVVNVPWVPMAYDRPVKNVLFDMVHRWDLDLPHHEKRQAKVSETKKIATMFTKPIFRTDHNQCNLFSNVHIIHCKKEDAERSTVLSVNPPKKTSHVQVRLSEEMLKTALLVIFHYRYTGEENLREKCRVSTTLMGGYNFKTPEQCVSKLQKLNSPDIFDPIMVRKWNYRHGTNITVSKTPPV